MVYNPVMEFRIADTFTDSLARLSGDEQKAAKMAAFDLQINPASPAYESLNLGVRFSVKAMKPSLASLLPSSATISSTSSLSPSASGICRPS